MTKKELENKIAEEIKNLSTEEKFAEELTEELFGNTEEIGIFLKKDENGIFSLTVDNGECYPPTFTLNEFLQAYAC